jgi:hypothetical protein
MTTGVSTVATFSKGNRTLAGQPYSRDKRMTTGH